MVVSNKAKGYSFFKEVQCSAADSGDHYRKSSVPAMNMGTNSALAPDTQQTQAVELVVDESVLGKLAARANRVPFNTRLVFTEDGGVPFWAGEGAGAGLIEMGPLTYTSITPKHLANIFITTDEMVRHSAVEVESLLRRFAARGLSRELDAVLLDPNNSGSSTKPAAITNGIVAYETFSDMMDEGFTGDLTKSVWVARPETWTALQSAVNSDIGLNGGVYQGAPGFASRAAPVNSLILIDPTGLYFALGEMEYETSRAGVVAMVDTPSTQNSVTPTASQVVSLYEAGAVATKLSMYVNWLVREKSVGMITFDGSPSGSPV